MITWRSTSEAAIIQSDPDMGQWTYEYDAAGNLITQTDAMNNALWFKYDPLNRVTEKRQASSSGSLLARYTYDQGANAVGRRNRMDDPSGYTTWAYDSHGRVITETKVISNTGGGTFVTRWDYDALDRPLWLKYPGGSAGQVGEQVNFTYHKAGGLQSVVGASPYVQSTTYDAAGRVDVRVLGSNVLQQDYVYFPWTTGNGQGRLQQIKAGTPISLTALQDLRYTYEAVGNVVTIKDYKTAGGVQTQTFHYDSLDRLTDATASGGTGGTYGLESYTYNPIGNLTGKAGVTQWYSDTLHKHAVTHLNGVQKFWYDANGNMTTRNDSTGNFSQQWDRENRLITVTGTATGYFVYDGDGNRVKATLNGVTTAYIGNYYEQTGAAIKKYYYAGGTRIAVNDNGTLYWLLGDHLGSTSLAAHGTTGALVSEQRYKPWGETRYTNGTMPTRHLYTGQISDTETGLYFYGARYYSSVLGRFLSADTMVPDGKNPQAWNRYSYVYNRPLNFIDPTGHCAVAEDQDACGIYSNPDLEFQNYLDAFAGRFSIDILITRPILWSLSDVKTIYQAFANFPEIPRTSLNTLIFGGISNDSPAEYNHAELSLTIRKMGASATRLMMKSLGVDADTVVKINTTHELIHAAQRGELTQKNINAATTYEDKIRKKGASIDWMKVLGLGASVQGFTDLFGQQPNYEGMFPKRPNGELLIQLEPVPFLEGMAIAGSMNMYAPWNIGPELQTWAQSAGYGLP